MYNDNEDGSWRQEWTTKRTYFWTDRLGCCRHEWGIWSARFAKTDIDGASDIPGLDPIDLLLQGEKLPQSGILVNAKIAKGYKGVINIYEYDGGENPVRTKINDYRPESDNIEMHFTVLHGSVSETHVTYENPNYFYKTTEPGMRNTPTSYLSSEFRSLDVIPLSDGGRLFITKVPNISTGISTEFHRKDDELSPQSPTRNVVRLFDSGDYQAVIENVGAIFTKLIGIAQQDIDTTTTQLMGKLAIPPQAM